MPDNEETNGLSLRDLVLEVRQDIKDIREERKLEALAVSKRPTRSEIYGAIGAVSVLLAIFSTVVRAN